MNEPRGTALRIVFISANPYGTTRIFASQEYDAIRGALQERSAEVMLEGYHDVTVHQFIETVTRPADILHISAHTKNGRVQLHDGTVSLTEIAELVQVARGQGKAPRLVVLNACDTALGLEALCEQVDCAIGMEGQIDERPAYSFSAILYSFLGRGLSVAKAFSVAMLRLKLPEQNSDVPRLYHRIVDPDHIVLLPIRGLHQGARVVGNRYELTVEALGRGAMGTVYEAVDLCSNELTRVAVKILDPRNVGNLILEDRFFRGATVLKSLSHPHIVKVLDIGARSDPNRYFVMQLVRDKAPLLQYVASQRLDHAAVIALGLQVGGALVHTHEKGYFHRDVTPTNILVDGEGRAYLIDFDLVRDEHVAGGTTLGTLGNPRYIAPEVVMRPQSADAASDQYSLAMTIAAALAMREPPPRNSNGFLDTFQCSEAIKSVLRIALSEEPDRRFGTTQSFCNALSDAVIPPVARRPSRPPTRPAPPPRRYPWPRFIAGGLVFGALVGALFWLDSSVNQEAALLVAPQTKDPRPTRAPYVAAEPALPDALKVDRSRAAFSIRIAADDTLAEIREDVDAVLRESTRFQPWIIHEGNNYYVFVNEYPSRKAAEADLGAAKLLRKEGGMIRDIQLECKALRLGPDGYHICD